MIVAGIDIGSRAAKAILLQDDKIISSHIGDTGPESVKTSYQTMSALLAKTPYSLSDVQYVMATGYGRVLVPFANENISEISAHARGINFFYPSVRTILDMGGQDCKAISCDAEGRVTNFVMNDKCAGGTGRFLEMIAEVLGLTLKESSELALQSGNIVPFNTICAVFAKTEALQYLRKGMAKADILAGLNEAISTRSLNLLKKVGIQPDFTITGGISKNKGMVAAITAKVGMPPKQAEDPQLMGALGAALFARDKVMNVGRSVVMKVHYGFTDATGDYFISVDGAKCDGCGDCVPACPAGLLAVMQVDGAQPKAAVKDALRKRIAVLCPGIKSCSASRSSDCERACKKGAITHSW